jgi:hypothetical protein
VVKKHPQDLHSDLSVKIENLSDTNHKKILLGIITMLIVPLPCRMFGLALDLRKWAKKSAKNFSNDKREAGGTVKGISRADLQTLSPSRLYSSSPPPTIGEQ